MFQFRRFPPYTYLIQCTVTRYCRAGFPHSEIHGSKLMCSSPWLIAACHVLRRLLMPRHSPCALFSLTIPPARGGALCVVHSCSQNHAGFTEDSILAKLKCYPFPLCFIGLPQDFRPAAPLCCLAFFSSVQFSRCRKKIHSRVPSKLNNVREKSLTWEVTQRFRPSKSYDFWMNYMPRFARHIIAARSP